MAPAAGVYGANLNESVQLHTSTQDSEDNWKCTASPADGGATARHRLAGPTPAIAASRRVPANEAPAHGFSGGHLLLKGYLNQQTVDGIRSLFDACGLGFHG